MSNKRRLKEGTKTLIFILCVALVCAWAIISDSIDELSTPIRVVIWVAIIGVIGIILYFTLRKKEVRDTIYKQSTETIGKERISLTTNEKNKVKQFFHNKCAYPKCKETKTLDFHHINEDPSDNRIENILLLCPTHHRKWHELNRSNHREALKEARELQRLAKGNR